MAGLADKSTTWLARYVEDMVRQAMSPNSVLDKLTVTDLLTIIDQVDISPAARASFAAIEPWQEVGVGAAPGFSNGWVNYGGVYRTAAFKKDLLGFVHLRGLVATGTAGTSIFTLPDGYRPGAEEIFGVINNGAFTDLRVAAAGTVAPVGGNNVWLSLAGITFFAG